MTRSRNQFVKIPLNGKTLLIIAVYSFALMCMGGALKSCKDKANVTREKIVNTRIR